jgi:hypothetical protein
MLPCFGLVWFGFFVLFFCITCFLTLRFAHLLGQISQPLLSDGLFSKQLSLEDVPLNANLLCSVGFDFSGAP